jgi:2-haloacid dehalogenase
VIEFLLLDLDDTILDFKKAEQVALGKTLQQFYLDPTPEVCARYSAINKSYWEMLERKEITREQLRPGRFEMLFKEYGMAVDAHACAREYEANLSQGCFFLPGARQTLPILAKKYKLYIVSNGNLHVQKGRLEGSGILPFFRDCFISEQMGAAKPHPVFFRNCFARIPDFDPTKAMIVGDSLTSDILGGKQAGILTCWVNPKGLPCPADLRPDYQIEALTQLPELLEQL